MIYELKEYTKAFEEELIKFVVKICVQEHGLEHYEKGLIDHVKNEKVGKRLILLDGKDIIATICYVERNEEIAEIKKVYIEKEYRGQGIGKKMVNMMIDHIKKKGYKSIYVGTSNHFENARPFYEKLGFKFKFYEGDGYILEMKLAQN